MTDSRTNTTRSAPTQSPRKRFWQKMLRNPLTVASLVWITLLLLSWIWPSLLARYDPYVGDTSLTRTFEGPSWDHWLGTDGLGRDFYSRVIFGARLAVKSILIAMTVALGLGVPVGLFSGWRGGRADRIIMWINDVVFSLPIVLVAMAVIIVLQPSLESAMLGVGLAMATRFARLTRAVTLAEKEELYVDAARISGLSSRTILGRYIAPNLLPTLIVQVAIISGAVILIGATLSFLGAGIPSPTPAWGLMVAEGRDYITSAWWISFFPGVAIFLTVMSLNFLGDWLRDRLDPRLRQI